MKTPASLCYTLALPCCRLPQLVDIKEHHFKESFERLEINRTDAHFS